mgnify:CR=1 FL=1
MNRIITYAVDRDDGMVWSRVGSQVALPMLQWDSMTPENGFTPDYALEAFGVTDLAGCWPRLKWTKKVPTAIKNRHRAFWGMKGLRI